MRCAGETPDGLRARALIVILWRAGLRISEALALAESDLDHVTGAVLVRRGKGGKRREVGMDRWGWQQLGPWLDYRPALPVGALLCVMQGPTVGRPCHRPRHGASCATSPSWPACDAASHRISLATLTQSRWRARAYRSPSSSASSGTRTSASLPSICKASTTAKSSIRSSRGRRRCCPRVPASADRRRRGARSATAGASAVVPRSGSEQRVASKTACRPKRW